MAAFLPLSILAAGPVTLDTMRTYLRVDGRDDDDMIAAVLAAARDYVERRCGRLLCPQIWRMRLDAWPADRRITVPLVPFRSVVAIRVYDAAGIAVSLRLSDSVMSGNSEPAWIAIANAPEPGQAQGGIEIDVEAGYAAASDVPAALTLAIMRVAARLYEQRGDAETKLDDEGLDALIAPYRYVRVA